ncbi:hypothetical protein A5791_19940 [Mycobacterium sp. 852002-51163_SCH5372311]|nr:hypothetical protein A5791_19940 [Mycobacterium sp. 852002-51163_SCH5372311]
MGALVRRRQTRRRAPTVTVTGRQFDDGAEVRGVVVVLDANELRDTDEARALAAVLLKAVSELERSAAGH